MFSAEGERQMLPKHTNNNLVFFMLINAIKYSSVRVVMINSGATLLSVHDQFLTVISGIILVSFNNLIFRFQGRNIPASVGVG